MKIPMTEEGRRRMARQKELKVRIGKLSVVAMFAVCVMLLVIQL